MKTFTHIYKFPEGSSGANRNARRILVIDEDPKRPGLLRCVEIQVGDGKPRRYSIYYGKCNQAKILEMTKTMHKV